MISYTNISKNKNPRKNRTHNPSGKITKITIHHMAAVMSGKACADYFTRTNAASANYCIGNEGDIALSVPEDYRAWTSSNQNNDYNAVTIEVSNSAKGGDWLVSDKAYSALIDLCVDICERNGIEKLVYTGDAKGNLTRHNMFANTNCPGAYLQGKFPQIAETVNNKLRSKQLYRVRRSWGDTSSQIGAYISLDNAKKATKHGYKVFDSKGNVVYDKPIIKGDVDGDGRVTAADARLALRYAARLAKLEDWQIEAADVNGDGKVTAADAREILRMSARLK